MDNRESGIGGNMETYGERRFPALTPTLLCCYLIAHHPRDSAFRCDACRFLQMVNRAHDDSTKLFMAAPPNVTHLHLTETYFHIMSDLGAL